MIIIHAFTPWHGKRPRGWRTGRVAGNVSLLGGHPWGLLPGAARPGSSNAAVRLRTPFLTRG
jgi:hypothetical protein